MSIDSSTLHDQLNESLDSPKTALVFIETFLGSKTEKRQMFLNLLVPKLQSDDLDLVLQKANQRINGKTNSFVPKIENTEHDNIIPVKEENEINFEKFLSPETWRQVLVNVPPVDLCSFTRTSRYMNSVASWPHLWAGMNVNMGKVLENGLAELFSIDRFKKVRKLDFMDRDVTLEQLRRNGLS